MVTSTLRCVPSSSSSRSVPKVTPVYTRIPSWRNTTTTRNTRSSFAHITHTAPVSAPMLISAPMPIARRRYWPPSSITTLRMMTSTCSTIRLSFAPSTSPNTISPNAYTPTIGKTTVADLVYIPMSLSYSLPYTALHQLEDQGLHLRLYKWL